MKELRLDYPLAFVSRVLSISASGYYSWAGRPLSKGAREESRLEVEIRTAHKRTRQTYSAERLQEDLAKNGVRVGICRIKRIRRKLGIRCKQKRKFCSVSSVSFLLAKFNLQSTIGSTFSPCLKKDKSLIPSHNRVLKTTVI
ncbi:IS3 family transposase [Chloroflexota bacterium]